MLIGITSGVGTAPRRVLAVFYLQPSAERYHHPRHIPKARMNEYIDSLGKASIFTTFEANPATVKCPNMTGSRKTDAHMSIRNVPIQENSIRPNECTVHVSVDTRHTPQWGPN